MNILLINKSDGTSGAMRASYDLRIAAKRLGHKAWQAVGQKFGNMDNTLLLDNESHGFIQKLFRRISRIFKQQFGLEDFSFPGIHRLPASFSENIDIVNCHNLHDQYFDLRILPKLSRRKPVLLTLHDAWLLSGHCAYSIDCERWKTGCGKCPYLRLYPAVQRDATAYNWRKKRDIFLQSRLYVTTASQLLMDKALASMLAPAIISSKVIPTGVDSNIYCPAEASKSAIREKLILPPDAFVAIFAAKTAKTNPYKDFDTIHKAMRILAAQKISSKLFLLVLGDHGDEEHLGNVTIRYQPFEVSQKNVAEYYQAADCYAHAAKADTFPYVVLEAMACALPVVATAVGGIPEQVRENQTGFLTPAGDAAALAERVKLLMEQPHLRKQLGATALKEARTRFDLNSQTSAYFNWMENILEKRR